MEDTGDMEDAEGCGMAGEAVDDGGRRKQLQKMQKTQKAGMARDGLGRTMSMYADDNPGGARNQGLAARWSMGHYIVGLRKFPCHEFFK